MTARTTGAEDNGARGADPGPDAAAAPMTADGKAQTVTLAHHWADKDGNDYLPGDKVKVDADTAAGLLAAGYLKREDGK